MQVSGLQGELEPSRRKTWKFRSGILSGLCNKLAIRGIHLRFNSKLPELRLQHLFPDEQPELLAKAICQEYARIVQENDDEPGKCIANCNQSHQTDAESKQKAVSITTQRSS
jgi:hypothetical protein